jgi:hypothetical protein
MLWFRQLSEDGHDPVQLLRTNAKARVTPLSGPAVLDPDTGRAAKRYAIPYRVWAKPGALRGLLEGGLTMHQHVLDFSALKLMKSIPEGVRVSTYGRSNRLTLLLDREPPLLTARVFPGGLTERTRALTDGRLSTMARVLLARSGVAVKPYPFHLLRKKHWGWVERAVEVPVTLTPANFRGLEIDLLKGAEEDRMILNAMMSASFAWESIGDSYNNQRRESHG